MPKKSRVDDGAESTFSNGESSTASQGSSPIDDMAGSAKQAASQAKDAASRVLDQAKDQAASRADQQRQTVASGFQAVGQAFRSLGEDLRKQDQGPVAHYAAEVGNAMAQQVDRVANYLQSRDVRQLVSDTEAFARRSPAIFLGGAFVLGLAASRFLKTSRPYPDVFANMPDPSHALPPASPEVASSQPYTNQAYPDANGAGL